MARKLVKLDSGFEWKTSPADDQLEWYHDVCRVRDVRNYVAHLPRPRVPADEFRDRWAVLKPALMRLGASAQLIDQYLVQDFYGMRPQLLPVGELLSLFYDYYKKKTFVKVSMASL